VEASLLDPTHGNILKVLESSGRTYLNTLKKQNFWTFNNSQEFGLYFTNILRWHYYWLAMQTKDLKYTNIFTLLKRMIDGETPMPLGHQNDIMLINERVVTKAQFDTIKKEIVSFLEKQIQNPSVEVLDTDHEDDTLWEEIFTPPSWLSELYAAKSSPESEPFDWKKLLRLLNLRGTDEPYQNSD